MKAMIFAAGLGTRLKPLTDVRPKALVELNGATLLELAIRKLETHGFSEILINIHAFGHQIIDFIESKTFKADIHLSDERDLLLDTGGGLTKAIETFSINEPLLVYNVDLITNANLLDFYNQAIKNDSIATLMVRKRKTARYLLFNPQMNLVGWRNVSSGEEILVDPKATDAEEYAFSGIHVVNPSIKRYFPAQPKVFPLIPFYLEIAKTEKVSGAIDLNSQWYDVGKLEQLNEAALFLKNNPTY